MERYMSLLLEIWRLASEHLELQESLVRILPALRRELPLGRVEVRRFDLEHAMNEAVIAVAVDSEVRITRETSAGTLEQMQPVVEWCRQRRVNRLGAMDTAMYRLFFPGPMRGDVLAAPLLSQGQPIGVALFIACPDRAFTPLHEQLVRELSAPFAVVLANDILLRQERTRRETAEADRRSLLTKLGRKDISDTIVGAEGGLQEVMERVRQVSTSDVPVLIFGETGSGKEVIARAIHRDSTRGSGPFLRVNCGAIPPELVDSELFGHERGSFTGAVAMRKGWFERADGGSLFLDEIGELPQAAQVRLLRILQDGTFERVGGQRQLTVDVRIVAATHRDLSAMVDRGQFRADLWYRIAIFPIHLPPLRDRPQDMGALAHHFAQRASRRFGLPPLSPSLEDINLLIGYNWPGNIRELAAVIDRAAILGNGDCLEIAKALGVPPEPRPKQSDPRSAIPVAGTGSQAPPADRFPTLDEVIIAHIQEALERTRGRIEGPHGAAAMLAMNPHTLRSRMRKMGVRWKEFRAPSTQWP
ncbi:sigma-54-dependent Fis family transcriptional regulator [bacterium]|nr:sigma-54-dependent Fis family transcriptional regulator [candidate division CSSED10-310 bacterium]